MSLIIKIKKVEQSQDNKSVSFDDITGAYDATTNPGGYGAPNPLHTEILRSIFQITDLKTGDISYVTVPSAVAFANPAGSLVTELDSYHFGQTASDEDLTTIKDGTYQIRYMPIFAAPFAVGVTDGSKTVTGVNLSTTLANTSFILIDGKLYEVDKVNGFGAASIELKTAFDGTTGATTAETGPVGTVKFGLIGVGNTAMINAIGRRIENSDTDELFDTVILKFGADANEGIDMVKYQKIVDTFNSYFRLSC